MLANVDAACYYKLIKKNSEFIFGRDSIWNGVTKRIIISISPKQWQSAAPVCGENSAVLLSATTKLSPQATQARRAGAKIAATQGAVRVTSSEFRAASGMRCAAVSTREANAIISAARRDMIGATLYMVCIDPETDELVSGTNSCAMCKRLIINAGIAKVVVRDTQDSYRAILVEDWVANDESLEGVKGY